MWEWDRETWEELEEENLDAGLQEEGKGEREDVIIFK